MYLTKKDISANCDDLTLLFHGLQISHDLHKEKFIIECNGQIEIPIQYKNKFSNPKCYFPINIKASYAEVNAGRITLYHKNYCHMMKTRNISLHKLANSIISIMKDEVFPFFLNPYGESYSFKEITRIII